MPETRARAQVGDVVIATRAGGGHNYVLDCKYEVLQRPSPEGTVSGARGTLDGGDSNFIGNSITASCYRVVGGEAKEKEVARPARLKKKKAELKELAVKTKEVKESVAALEKFKTDDEEIRHHLSVMVGGDEEKVTSTLILAKLLGAEDKLMDMRKG